MGCINSKAADPNAPEGKADGGAGAVETRASSPTSGGSPANPTSKAGFNANEKILAELNAVRTNPASLIPFLEAKLPHFDGKTYTVEGKTPLITQEGTDVVNELIEYLKTAPAIGPLALDDHLNLAAQVHAEDIGPKGITGHVGSDDSQPQDRVERFCEWKVTVGENIDFGNTDPKEIVAALMTDDGVPGRGHRNNIMNDKFAVVGICTGTHAEFGNLCVQVLAGGTGPKREKFEEEREFVDVTKDTVGQHPDFEKVLAAIPAEQAVADIRAALETGNKVTLHYKITEIDVTVTEESGAMSMFSAGW